LVLCNRPTSESRRTVSVYEVSMVFRQKERGANFLYKVNLSLSPDKFKTLKGKHTVMGIVQRGNKREEPLRGRAYECEREISTVLKKTKTKKKTVMTVK